MGFTDVGFMKYSLVADHYQHIAIIGVIALASAGFSMWHQRAQGAACWMAKVVAIVAVAALTFLTLRQNEIYCDALTLYQTTLEKNPECYLIHNNLGNVVAQMGRSQEAIEHFQQALRLNPNYPEAHKNLGLHWS